MDKLYDKIDASIKAIDKLIEEIIQNRKNELDWYVLKYDMQTTEYNNKIVFKTYEEALKEYNETEASYINERIELIFSPQENDKLYCDNVLIQAKFYEKLKEAN